MPPPDAVRLVDLDLDLDPVLGNSSSPLLTTSSEEAGVPEAGIDLGDVSSVAALRTPASAVDAAAAEGGDPLSRVSSPDAPAEDWCRLLSFSSPSLANSPFGPSLSSTDPSADLLATDTTAPNTLKEWSDVFPSALNPSASVTASPLVAAGFTPKASAGVAPSPGENLITAIPATAALPLSQQPLEPLIPASSARWTPSASRPLVPLSDESSGTPSAGTWDAVDDVFIGSPQAAVESPTEGGADLDGEPDSCWPCSAHSAWPPLAAQAAEGLLQSADIVRTPGPLLPDDDGESGVAFLVSPCVVPPGDLPCLDEVSHQFEVTPYSPPFFHGSLTCAGLGLPYLD